MDANTPWLQDYTQIRNLESQHCDPDQPQKLINY